MSTPASAGKKVAPAVILLGLTITLGVIGLVLAFALHATHIGAFIGIGLAAVIAPLIGMILPLWAIETDVNSSRGGDVHSNH
jgi:predicted membrane-bound spermidine synthase